MENADAIETIQEDITQGVSFLSKIWDNILNFLPTLMS